MAVSYWSNKTPAAPAGSRNVTFQSDGGSPEKRSAHVGPAVLGTPGVISLDAGGDSTKVLCGDGLWRVPPGGGGIPSVNSYIQTFSLFDDFVEFLPDSGASTRAGRLGRYYTGTGASVEYPAPPTSPGRVGILGLKKGTATGQTTVTGLHTAAFIPGAGEIVFECELSTDQDLSAINFDNAQIQRVGFGDVRTGAPDNTIMFQLIKDDNPDSHGWRGRCSNGGTATITTSNYVPAAGEWLRLKFVVNAAGTSVEFFVNGSTLGTITTNIPTAALYEFYQIWTRTGATSHLTTNLLMDWVYIQISPSRALP